MIDLIGQKFGRLVIIRKINNDLRGNHRWICQCDCGKKTIVLGNNLRNNNTRSCGCLRTKHGNSKVGKISKTYKSWQQMVQRCTNINNPRFKDYGNRGIKVCRRWMKFVNFLEDMGERPLDKCIDRINNDGNYCKSNCKWSTSKQNSRNRRDHRIVIFNGKTQCLASWADETGIRANTLLYRINNGWSIQEAFTTPVGHKRDIYDE